MKTIILIFLCINFYRTDSALSYLVVEFKDEQQVDIIPRIWLKGKDKCLWPNYKHASRIEKAVRTKEIPDGSYGYHDIARIMYQTGRKNTTTD